MLYRLQASRWCSRLTHCATSRKDTGSILDGIIGNFTDIILPWNPGTSTYCNPQELSKAVERLLYLYLYQNTFQCIL